MVPEEKFSRRDFLKRSAVLGGGIVVGGTLLSKNPREGRSEQPPTEEAVKRESYKAKAEVVIQPEGEVEEQNIEWLPEPVKQLWPTIQTEAKKYGLDPRLIAIIITEESGGLNVANSEGSGAMGPMQLMPIAMQEYAQRGDDKQHGDISNPVDNIHIGCWLVHRVNEQYIKPSNVDLYSDMGILMLAVGYGDGIGALSTWQRNGMQTSQLSQQARYVSRLWTGMWHERNQSSSPTLNAERGYNT